MTSSREFPSADTAHSHGAGRSERREKVTKMAVRETSQRSKQFAYSYFDQVHARVKTLERKRDAQHPKRQPLIDRGGIPQGGIVFRPESSGGEQAVQAPEGEIHAAQALQNVAQEIDNAAETTPELLAVAEGLKDIADDIDKVVDDKIRTVQNRFSYATFREAAASVLSMLPPLNLRQRVMAVYHVGVGFFLQEDRNQGAGIQGTIQGWPEQFIRENHELNQAVEDAGGFENVLDSSVD